MNKMEEKDTVKKSLTDFGNETTIHGLQFVVNKKNIVYRLCWLGICVTFTIVFLIQGNVIMKDFLRWPYSTKIDIIGRPSLAFPAVTVCNANMMKRSQMAGTRFHALVDLDGGVQGADYDYSWWFSSGYINGYPGYSSWYGGSTYGGWGSSSLSEGSFDGQSSSSNYGPSSSRGSSSASSEGSSDGQSSSNSYGPSSSQVSSSVSSEGSSDGQSSSSNYGPSSSRESSSASSGGSSDGQISSSSYDQSSSRGSSSQSSERSSDGQSLSSSDGPSSSRGSSSKSSEGSSYYQPPSYSYNFQSSWINFADWSWYNPSEFEDFQFYDYNWDGVSSAEDWEGFYKASKADDYSDFLDVVNPTKEELAEHGHQLEDFIVQCTFDRRQCNISRDFHVWQNRYFGNCFTFNSNLSQETEHIHTGKTGGLNGLHLTLFVEQPEYLGILSPHTGAKVSIHHPNEHPFPEDNALAVPTGQETSIGIRQEFIKRLGGYYTNCTMDGSNTNFSSSDYSYSMSSCKKTCYQLHLSQLCECVDDQFFDDYPIKCDVLNRTHQLCRQFVEDLHLDDKLLCSCPAPCEEVKYVKTPSSSLWPSERYEEHLFRRLNNSDANENLLRILQSNELSRKNLVRLKIFYEDLNYEFVEMVPVYTIPSLLGSVGGLMGLYIGMSFISVFEVLFLVLRIIKIAFTKIYSQLNRVQPHPVKNV